MSLLDKLFAEIPANENIDKLRAIGKQIMEEQPHQYYGKEYEPTGKDILLVLPISSTNTALRWLVLRLLTNEIVVIEIYEHAFPLNYTTTYLSATLRPYPIDNPQRVITAFLTEYRERI